MSELLDGLLGVITTGATAAATVIQAKDAKEIAQAEAEVKAQELAYQKARETRATLDAATSALKGNMENETLNKIVMWTVTTIAGGVLVGVVLKLAGVSK